MPLIVKDEGEQASVYINGSIADDDALVAEGYEFPRNVRKQLEACRGKKLTVYINSYGGSVAAGLAMANMIARHDKATTAIVEGVCCSIATQIFFSARKCKMPSNTFLMIHKPTSAVEGTADEIRKAAEALDAIQSGLETTYQSKALDGVTSERIHEMMNEETWLTGSEAATLFNIEVLSPVQAVNCTFPRGALKSTKVPTGIKFYNEVREKTVEEIKAPLAKGAKKMEKETARVSREEKARAFNSLALVDKRQLSGATRTAMYEAAGITPSDGPLVIPPEQMATISARRQGQTSLKEHCRVIPVSRPNGFWFALDTPGLTIRKTDFRQGKLEQASVLPLAQPSGRTVDYRTDDYMLEFRLPNSMIADANELGVNVLDLLADDIARAEIANENAAITEQLVSLQASALSTYSDLLTALMIDLPSRYCDAASIVTNNDGLLWLATITDSSGRLLIPPTAAQSDGLRIWGKPVLAIDNAVLPTVDNKIPLYVGDLGQYCLFIERQDTEIMTSQDIWFAKHATAIRLTRRFCVLVDKAEAMRRYEITKGA